MNKFLITMAQINEEFDVSIIIVNYNTSSLILDCVKSIYNNNENVKYEIIIVDNNSPDKSGNLLKLTYASDERISVVLLKENLGFGKANNVGVEYAKGRNVFFLNPDTILINESVEILSDYLDSNDTVGAVGGNLFDANNQPTHSFHRIFPSLFSEISAIFFHIPEYIRYGKNQRFNHTGSALSVADITGADLMVKRKVLDEVGAFSPDFFMYYEETELCWRIKSKGYDIISYPKSKIQHLEGKSSSNMKRKASIVFSSRESYYKITHKTTLYYFVANIFFCIYCVEHILLDSFRKNGSKEFWCQMIKLLFLRNSLKSIGQ